jgi:DNA-binding transcriptional LysR family regulator
VPNTPGECAAPAGANAAEKPHVVDDILIFVKVTQFDSISRAARSLGMPISTVSRRLSVLESKLGVSLLRRTTRRVTLAAQGREYFNQCREPLTLLEDAERVLTVGQKTPEGTLRISVPVILGQEPFLDFLSGFQKAQPRIRIDLFITNIFLDLVAENIDVAIRFGELEDLSVVAIRIGKSIRCVVAAASLEESTVDQGMKGSASHGAGTVVGALEMSNRYDDRLKYC